jgi:hypothetical protein
LFSLHKNGAKKVLTRASAQLSYTNPVMNGDREGFWPSVWKKEKKKDRESAATASFIHRLQKETRVIKPYDSSPLGETISNEVECP